MKDFFKNMPIEISINEWVEISKTHKLYSSWKAMVSGEKLIYILDTENDKLYGFSPSETEYLREYGAKSKHYLLQIN